jgi:multiple antibiotic resistance protein
VEPRRRRVVLLRELAIAYGVLIVFLLLGSSLLRFLGLEPEAVSIAAGIVLFLIALRMIFPSQGSLSGEAIDGEPFVVPATVSSLLASRVETMCWTMCAASRPTPPKSAELSE